MKEKVKNLEDGMDKISVEYVEKFMDNTKYWDKCINKCLFYNPDNRWTSYDKKLFKEIKSSNIINPYKDKLQLDDYMYTTVYGLKDLPRNVFENINGKDILDIGAQYGDTAYLFYKNFPDSNIYSYEPVYKFYKILNVLVSEINNNEKTTCLIHPINKGVGDGNYSKELSQSYYSKSNGYSARLDDEYESLHRNNLGLIKIDVEGMESLIIENAQNTIKKYKPVLVIAIYHRPEDFFEMKDKLRTLNPDYKFLIRRSGIAYPDVEIVLIAYNDVQSNEVKN